MAATAWLVPGKRRCPGLQQGAGQGPAGQPNPSALRGSREGVPKIPQGLVSASPAANAAAVPAPWGFLRHGLAPNPTTRQNTSSLLVCVALGPHLPVQTMPRGEEPP